MAKFEGCIVIIADKFGIDLDPQVSRMFDKVNSSAEISRSN
jgi:hypothetical protein